METQVTLTNTVQIQCSISSSIISTRGDNNRHTCYIPPPYPCTVDFQIPEGFLSFAIVTEKLIDNLQILEIAAINMLA